MLPGSLLTLVAGLLLTEPVHAQCFSCGWKVGQPVKTTSGIVHGHRARNATDVSEYLGIPFARPPLNELRFSPPVRYYGSSNISGENFGYICPQSISEVPTALPYNAYNFLSALGSVGQQPNEDCLTINVWTKPQTGSVQKPVMVWIYGGGYSSGGTNTTGYSGQYWAATEDVVFVNFNYRLGIFGFPGSPGLTQNVGLLDQRMAFEWTRDNIAAFGGDPNRITIFGESAGAASADFHNYINLDDPIFSGTITESGTANSFGNNAAQAQADKWYALTKTLGCGDNTTTTDTALVTCLRAPNITTAALLNATAARSATSVLAAFGPTIDNKTVFADYTALNAAGKFVRRPYLTGSNDYEAGLFKLLFAGAGITQNETFWDALTQNTFTCPANVAAAARQKFGVPVWRYRYFGGFPNLNLPLTDMRAYHASEIFPLFGTDQDLTRTESTGFERSLGSYMRSAWAAFAHCPERGLADFLEWPQYSPEVNGTEGLVLLGRNNQTVEFSARGPYDGTCPGV